MSHTFKQQKNRLLLSLILLTALLMPHPALADEEYGRYRAIVLHEGGQANSSGSIVPRVFIIDSKERSGPQN